MLFRSLSVTLLVLLFSTCLGSEQAYRQALGSIISDRVLLGWTIAKFKTSDFLSCAQKCLAHSLCKSYNYYNTTENNGLCEINSENQGDVEEHFSFQPGSLFGRLMAIKVSAFEEVYCNKKVFCGDVNYKIENVLF